MSENIIGTRLEQFIDYLKISQNEFAKGIGLSSGLISYITTGKTNFGVDKLVKIKEKYPDLNIEWLVTGKGSMIKSVKEIEKDMIELLSNKGIEIIDIDAPKNKNESYLYLPFKELTNSELNCFKINDDSLSPYLFIGDYILAEKNKNWKYNLHENQLCVICTKNDFTVGNILNLDAMLINEIVELKINTEQKTFDFESIVSVWNVKCKITYNISYGLSQSNSLDLIASDKKNNASSFIANIFSTTSVKPVVFYFGVMTPEIKQSILRDIKKISVNESLGTIKSKRLFVESADCLEIKQITNTSADDVPTTFFSLQKTDSAYTIIMGKALPKIITNKLKENALSKKELNNYRKNIYNNPNISLEEEIILGLVRIITKSKSELLYEFVDLNNDFDLFLIKIII